jgi:hypothetical protein
MEEGRGKRRRKEEEEGGRRGSVRTTLKKAVGRRRPTKWKSSYPFPMPSPRRGSIGSTSIVGPLPADSLSTLLPLGIPAPLMIPLPSIEEK